MGRNGLPREKVEAVKQCLKDGHSYKKIQNDLNVSKNSIARIKQRMIDDGEEIPEGKVCFEYSKQIYLQPKLREFDRLRLPIKKYYERLRNEQRAKKIPGEIKQIRLVKGDY